MRLAVRCLSVAPGGLLHAFRLEDPERLVRNLRLELAGRHLDLDLHRAPGGTGLSAGFVPLDETEAAPCRIQVVLGSGRITTMATVQPAAFDGTAPEGFADVWEVWHRISGPPEANPARALAAARSACPPRRIPVLIQRFGPIRAGRIALIAPAGTHPDLILPVPRRSGPTAGRPRSSSPFPKAPRLRGCATRRQRRRRFTTCRTASSFTMRGPIRQRCCGRPPP